MLGVRIASDGTYWIPRENAEIEAYMDLKYTRMPNQLRWVSKVANILEHYKDNHANEIAHIVGKGPSLDKLKAKDFEDKGPIICINESILKVESTINDSPIYGVQLDNELGETCKPSNTTTRLFVSPRCGHLYEEGVSRIVVDPRSFFLPETCLSVQFAIELAKLLGCTSLVMHCFDGCIGNDFDYANCVGYDSSRGGSKLRFKDHKKIIIEQARGLRLTWLSPTGVYLDPMKQ